MVRHTTDLQHRISRWVKYRSDTDIASFKACADRLTDPAAYLLPLTNHSELELVRARGPSRPRVLLELSDPADEDEQAIVKSVVQQTASLKQIQIFTLVGRGSGLPRASLYLDLKQPRLNPGNFVVQDLGAFITKNRMLSVLRLEPSSMPSVAEFATERGRRLAVWVYGHESQDPEQMLTAMRLTADAFDQMKIAQNFQFGDPNPP